MRIPGVVIFIAGVFLAVVVSQGLEAPAAANLNKWSLWQNGPHLRGANIHQRRSYPDADGSLAGTYPIIPPYTQADFYGLAALNANYVNISHPGLYTETPPYQVDPVIQNNLDQLLAMISQANMFAVISFRTGPGRNEFTFLNEEDPGWLGYSKDINTVWTNQAAQDAWVQMWRYTADRYRNHPAVVGYDLMVEPNSNVLLNVWEPTDFYPAYANTLYDWNQLHPRLSAAIRQVDTNTPLLTGAMSYSSVWWLPYLKPTADTRTVYTVHHYQPFGYTHQYPPLTLGYPGVFDADGDGNPDTINKSRLADSLSPITTFQNAHARPVAVNEYGVMRWEPGADRYMADMMAVLEDRGLNHALWVWQPADDQFAEWVNDFNLRFGPRLDSRQEVSTSHLLNSVGQNWGHNTIRPGPETRQFLYLPALRPR